jgi:hypothetical protein
VKVNVSDWFIKYRIPIKVGSQEESWAVNWPRLSPNEVVGGGMSVRALLFNAFVRQPIPISAITKFDNTMKFFDFAKTRKE